MRKLIFLLPFLLRAQTASFDSDTIAGLGARNLGPGIISGRVAAVTAVRENGRLTVFVGTAAGGVWKSVNNGTTFKPVFDKQPVQSIGAIAVDPSNPKIVWAGTGEAWTRNSVSIGDGIYRSSDGGENWTNLGLKNSERIPRLLFIRRIRPLFMRASLASSGATATTEAFIRPPMAAKVGTRFWPAVTRPPAALRSL